MFPVAPISAVTTSGVVPPNSDTEIAVLAPRWWMKAFGMLHPLLTVSAIVATANRWVLDAVGGAVVVGAGFGLTYVLSGPRAVMSPAAGAVDLPRDYAIRDGR